jgi:hypothetical protein
MKYLSCLALSTLMILMISAEGFGQSPSQTRPQQGSICIVAVPESNQQPITLANPNGGGRSFAYSIKIDDAPIREISHKTGFKISGLALKRQHTIKIFRDGKLTESFKFSFEKEKSSSLCLWFKSLYETWSLWDAKSSRHICKCT